MTDIKARMAEVLQEHRIAGKCLTCQYSSDMTPEHVADVLAEQLGLRHVGEWISSEELSARLQEEREDARSSADPS